MSLALQNFAVYCLQVTILVMIGGLLPFVCRLQSVRARLAWWQALLAVCLVLPLIQPWKQTFIDSSIMISTRAAAALPDRAGPEAAPFPWETVLLVALAAGIVLRLTWLAAGFLRLRMYLDRATIYTCPLARRMEVHAYVGLSEEVTSPVTFGLRQPVILFPTRFAAMEPAMQEAIACHELLHVHRKDWFFTVCEELVRALFWFHPAIWFLLGEIQLTREQVVDNEVVRLTESRDEYLQALLAIASTQARLDLAPAPLFLRKRHLSQRVSQILKEVTMSRSRIAASFAGISSLLLLAGWMMVRALPLEAAPQVKDAPGVSVDQPEVTLLHRSAVDYPVEAREKGIQGVVVLEVDIDENGAAADARVVGGPQELRRAALQSVLQWHFAKNMRPPATTRVNVKFQLPPPTATPPPPARVPLAIVTPPPARAATEVGILKLVDLSTLPEELRNQLQQKLSQYEGQPFTSQLKREIESAVIATDKHLMFTWTTNPHPASGQPAFGLRISLDPALAAAAATPVKDEASPPPPDGSTPKRIRVGGNVQHTMLVEQTRPKYPPEAKQARIQGVVRFNAIIGSDGAMQNLTVVSGHPLLVEAAIEAVKQWVYKPTLLNGEPVEVVTTIDVNFTLSQ